MSKKKPAAPAEKPKPSDYEEARDALYTELDDTTVSRAVYRERLDELSTDINLRIEGLDEDEKRDGEENEAAEDEDTE